MQSDIAKIKAILLLKTPPYMFEKLGLEEWEQNFFQTLLSIHSSGSRRDEQGSSQVQKDIPLILSPANA